MLLEINDKNLSLNSITIAKMLHQFNFGIQLDLQFNLMKCSFFSKFLSKSPLFGDETSFYFFT